ncbi:MAG: class I SAM-dependent rRNA methyltransferase [Flavobacteriales bacterium]
MISVITLKKGKEASLYRKHPWVFSGAIATDCTSLEDGQLVTVQGWNGVFLAKGHFQHGSISVRIISFQDQVFNQEFWNDRISGMIQLRKKLGLLSETNSIFRICHGEGDELPGLVIDYYTGVAVIQCHSIGMVQHLNEITEALKQSLGTDLLAVYHKSSETLPKRYAITDGYLYGEVPTPHYAKEDGITYAIDWINGQKTGFFIDQRDNRSMVGRLSHGKKVLNAFCYSGGFSLQALKNEATVVYSLDSSQKAIALVEENVHLNGFKDRHISVAADAMEFMKALPEEFDIIILDPPAFAKHLDKKHKAVQGYKRLNAHALRQIKSGGILITFSCSQVIDKALFNHTIIAAAIESNRNVKILYQLHQPADHPIGAFHPEGEYLKGLVVYVE